MSDFLNPHLTRPAVRWTSGDALPALEQTGAAAPLLIDSTTGRLLVDTEANLTADLSLIEGKQDTTNAILTTTAADVATIKAGAKNQDGSGNAITSTVVSSKRGLDVNVISGGGGGGGASAQYNATLPTYTSGDPATLQTDVNGRLITTGGLTDTQLRASAVPVSLASVPSHPVTNAGTFATQITNGANTLAVDSAGAVTVNNPASATYTNTVSGAISGGTIFLGPIDCGQFRQIMFQAPTMGTGMQFIPEISLDGTNYVIAGFYSITSGAIIQAAFSSGSYSGNSFVCPLYSAKFWRLRVSTGASGGTTTVVAYATQSANLIPTSSFITISGTPTINVQPTPSATNGFQGYHTLISAASVNATSVKTTNGTIGTLILTNSSATWAYFKLVNKASAPTPGTDTAIINIGVAPNTTLDCSSAFAGLRMATGIAYYVSAGTSLTDNTALPVAGTFLVNMTYV